MTIMDMVRKWQDKKKGTSQKFKEMQEDARLQKMLEERQKSSNKRELEKYYHDEEEKAIKEALDRIHKQKNVESWKGNNVVGKATMLKDDRPILKEKNLFTGNKTTVLRDSRGMYFK